MPKSKLKEYWDDFRGSIIKQVLSTIENNKGIKDEVLIAMLHVDPPYMDKKRSMEMISDLKMAGKITVNPEGEINLCR